MADVYFCRSGAARAAMLRGIEAFETYQPVPKADPNAWCYEERENGPGIEYAKDFAEGKDWIHHVEITKLKVPVLVVNITKEELKDEEIPKLFEVRPITPSLWDKQEPWKGPRQLATGYQPPYEQRFGRALRTVEGTPVILDYAAKPVPRAPRGEGSVAKVWQMCNAMPGASRKEVVAACVANGINPSTASVQYGAWKKSQEGG